MTIDTTVLMWAVGQVVVAAAIWGGIKAEIKSLHAQVATAQKTADEAHHRIDTYLFGKGH